jgi:hypothetical protein
MRTKDHGRSGVSADSKVPVARSVRRQGLNLPEIEEDGAPDLRRVIQRSHAQVDRIRDYPKGFRDWTLAQQAAYAAGMIAIYVERALKHLGQEMGRVCVDASLAARELGEVGTAGHMVEESATEELYTAAWMLVLCMDDLGKDRRKLEAWTGVLIQRAGRLYESDRRQREGLAGD